jgi:hypothetical protein
MRTAVRAAGTIACGVLSLLSTGMRASSAEAGTFSPAGGRCGSTWASVPGPYPNGYAFTGVTAIAPDDIWAVGKGGQNGVTDHRTSSGWTVVAPIPWERTPRGSTP